MKSKNRTGSNEEEKGEIMPTLCHLPPLPPTGMASCCSPCHSSFASALSRSLPLPFVPTVSEPALGVVGCIRGCARARHARGRAIARRRWTRSRRRGTGLHRIGVAAITRQRAPHRRPQKIEGQILLQFLIPSYRSVWARVIFPRLI